MGGKVKLPKITLPHFKGNPIYWTAFWDSYESAVHLNSTLSDVDKFNYLRSLLEKSAYDAIAGLTMSSSANYQEAIDILKKHFGDRQIIISRHMDTLLNLTAVTLEHDLRGLRRLYNDVEANVRSLKVLGVEQGSYGAMLTSVLLNKLPNDVRLIVTRKTPSDRLDLPTLLTVLEDELVARERSRDSNRGGRHPPDFKTRPSSMATTLLAGMQEKPNSCCYCQQSHPASDCQVVKGIYARKQILKASERCFNCLAKGHIGKKCRSSPQCQACKRRHHPSICNQTSAGTRESPSLAQTAVEATNVFVSTLDPEAPPFVLNSSTNASLSTTARSVLLQTARAHIYNPRTPDTRVELRMLLDGGSQRSYVTERAAKVLKLEPDGEQQLSIATFGSARGGPKVCPIVSVGVVLKGYSNLMMSLFVVPMICEPLVSQPIDACQDSQLAGLELADWADQESQLEVDILVGADQYWNIVTGAVSQIAGGPTAIYTKLGWVMSGPMPVKITKLCATNLVTTHVLRVDTQMESLDNSLKAFWELESLGIQPDEKNLCDSPFRVPKFNNGRYEVSLPWKEFHPLLPDNYTLSQRRLLNLLKRLRQDPTLLQDYDTIIREQIEKGIVEDAPPKTTDSAHLHYLPHHAVIRRDKDTTKMHVVYDASAKMDGQPSMNDCLLIRPKFNQKIFDLLVRFRSYPIALTADIEKAFLMVAVEQEDRDALRFLWVNDVTEEEPTIWPLRFTRVVFGVCSSPFLLNSTIRYHLEQHRDSHPDLIKKLIESFYVDDVVTGASDEEEVMQLYSEAKRILKDGAFNLRKFRTNSSALQHEIDTTENQLESPQGVQSPSLDETYADATLGKPHSTESSTVKVLGVVWDPGEDNLKFSVADVTEVAATIEPTKRNVVSIIGKFYDPLGYLAPVIIRFKRLFQKLCEHQVEWDESLPESLRKEWKMLVEDLRHSNPICIPRSYQQGMVGEVYSYSLCGFCDASTTAYAAVVYVVVKTEADSARCARFLASKTMVAPLQTLTVPRLELLSALLLSRLVTTVLSSLKSCLPVSEIECYTDSTVALHWIKGTCKEWKQFVQNRVSEIRQKTPPEVWNHCPGVTNPADLPSRGMTMSELQVSHLWHFGPEWLKFGPSTSALPEISEECMRELKTNSRNTHNLAATEAQTTIGALLDCGKFSSFRKLMRVTAYVLRAVERFKDKNRRRDRSPRENSMMLNAVGSGMPR